MADLALLALKVLGEIAAMAEGMEDVGQQADRFVRRLLSIEEPVRAIQEQKDGSVALVEVLSTLREARDFLSEYRKANKFTRACRRKSHAEKIADLSRRYE